MFQQLNYHLRKTSVGVKKSFYFNKIEKAYSNNGVLKFDNTITQHIFGESIILKGNPSSSFAYMTELHQCQHFTIKKL